MTKENYALLSKIINTRTPELSYLYDVIKHNERLLTDAEVDAIEDALSLELTASGFETNDEINARGRDLEALIAAVIRRSDRFLR